MILLYFLSWKSRSRVLQLIKIGNKGGKQSWEEKNDTHFPLCWIWYWSVFSLQTQSIFAHTHDYMTVYKMCIYDKDHFILSYKTTNAVNNLAKINNQSFLYLPLRNLERKLQSFAENTVSFTFYSYPTHLLATCLHKQTSHAVWSHTRWTGHGREVWQNVVHWRREWQTISVFLSWEPHEQYERQNDRTLKEELPRSVGS